MLPAAAMQPPPPAIFFGPSITNQVAVSAQTLPINIVPQPAQTIRGDNDQKPNQQIERKSESSDKKESGKKKSVESLSVPTSFLTQVLAQSEGSADEIIEKFFFGGRSPEKQTTKIDISEEGRHIPFSALAQDFDSEEAETSDRSRRAFDAFKASVELTEPEPKRPKAAPKEAVSFFV